MGGAWQNRMVLHASRRRALQDDGRQLLADALARQSVSDRPGAGMTPRVLDKNARAKSKINDVILNPRFLHE